MAPQNSRDLSSVEEEFPGKQYSAVLKRLAFSHGANDESKCTRQIDYFRVFTWREDGDILNVAKIDRFVGKESFVLGGIMLGNRAPLYVFEKGTIKSQRCRDGILEAYVRFFG
ncbi:hypothetical protein TNCV_919811 [Trichonephila clavipes]|nr:hypothetical protein TNCV_919811 [Trichonephila clavipes]